MLKIKKINDKKLVDIIAQDNCTKPGESVVFQRGQDCQDDCHKQGEAPSFTSTWTQFVFC
ncbi:hypothetical protein EQM13_02090 [Acidilutibacter cellobiosedens]|jgi:hypothetical protein|uniref:Uncharacterized protein n=1 Tax=Acidilutibacter cellobiosedens TaxID=2507161 RepID=A0A410Q919_9FIRM|nr:hypothetical protein [Acidilutibacter cellobiosedens]QAT60446.1 hypothetical protein EQM13_02090 [Acidilutibacter cellobiosedens]